MKQSLIPTPPPPPRPTTKAHSNSRNMQEDELSQFSKLDLIKSIDEICNLQLFSSRVSFSTKCFVMKLDCVRIQSHQFVQGTSVPEFLLLIRDDFTYDAYHYGIKTTIKSLSQNRITNLKRWSHIQEAIRYLSNCDVSGKKDVLREMICSMGPTPVGKKKYEIETLIRAFKYFSISRSAYFRFRRDYELPSVDTLTRITSKVRNAGDDAFLNQIFGSLENRQKTCYLLIDEVYVKPLLQYHGGSIYGEACNGEGDLAKTVLGFMGVTLFGGPKFLYRMLPVLGLSSAFLFEQTCFILNNIRKAGGNPVAIIVDGNRVNQSIFKKFDLTKPWLTNDGIVLLYDYVHLLKNVRNNWITEATKEINFVHEGKILTARWHDLEELLKLEGNLVKLSKLTKVSVYPTPIERQSIICVTNFL